MDSDSVWRALTSPHRRKVLELLRDGPMTTGQLAKSLPGLSRFAVMQHLGVLEEANLILPRKEGRARLNFINPMPLREQYDRWVSSFGLAAAETAQHLKRYAESKLEKHETMNEEGFRVVRIELETEVKAPPSVVFDALTKNLNDWWPHRMVANSVVSHDCVHGGQIKETWDGGGALYGTVVIFEEGKRCASVAAGFMGSCTITNDETVEAFGSGCRYKKSLRMWGVVPEDMERMFREGSAAIVETSLKAYCENGVKYVG